MWRLRVLFGGWAGKNRRSVILPVDVVFREFLMDTFFQEIFYLWENGEEVAFLGEENNFLWGSVKL